MQPGPEVWQLASRAPSKAEKALGQDWDSGNESAFQSKMLKSVPP